jgi:glutathione S-transferase
MIELYSRATPNGRKISIALEESGLPYRVHAVDFARREQKSPEFLRLNPNGRIPVIVDMDPGGGDGDGPVAVFESGAILLYIVEKSQRLLPADPLARIEALKWLFFASSQVTHIAMQVHWLVRLEEQGKPAPHLEDYRNELKRLFGVLDGVLARRAWLAGEAYSIADIAAWTWVERHPMHGVALDRFPALADWFRRVEARPATRKGYDIPPRAKP